MKRKQHHNHTEARSHAFRSGILAAISLAATAVAASGGQMVHDGKSMESKDVKPMPPANPLSFFDGKLVFDLHERIGFESRENNFDFNDAVDSLTDDTWGLQRFRIGMMVKPIPGLKFYVQAQDTREFDSDRPDFVGVLAAEGDDSFDLRQAYVEIGGGDVSPWSLKIGRQILAYGDERLVGPLEWNNVTRTFDAVKLRYEQPKWAIDAFVSSVVNVENHQYNQSDFLNGTENNRAQIFAGLYFTTKALEFQTTDLYAFYLQENTNSKFLPLALGNTEFATLGFRVKSTPGKIWKGFDYDMEAAGQFGEVRGLDHTAFAVHTGAGYTFNCPWKPRLGAEYNYASGDSDPTDGDIGTFQNLFPTNHKFYGYMDTHAWQNMHHIVASFKVNPIETVKVTLDYHAYWLATTNDTWNRANAVTAVRPLSPLARSASSYAGSEIDLTVWWTISKNVSLLAGYAHYFAGEYLDDTGAGDDADFGYAQLTFNF